ncbi:MAG: DUF692 family protein [Planctomycetes bacterium]|nr:DUF692 family protein [Planctomycetota bacterium]
MHASGNDQGGDQGFLGIGWALHPDVEYLTISRRLIEDEADFFEINPEALWRPLIQHGKTIGLERSEFHETFAAIARSSGKPFVAHGLGLSLATGLFDLSSDPSHSAEANRTATWLDRVASDASVFDFLWYSEHLGVTRAGGLNAGLPLPIPFTADVARDVVDKLRRMSDVVPVVAFENSANMFWLCPPAASRDGLSADHVAREEANFLCTILEAADCRLLLDIHNVWVESVNLGFDPFEFVDRLPLDRVLEIHLSGGSDSDPSWLASGREFRIDSHDGSVPEPCWELLDHVLPRCVHLRGVVLERLNGTFTAEHVDGLVEEMQRARSACRAPRDASRGPHGPIRPLPRGGDFEALSKFVVGALVDPDPMSRLELPPRTLSDDSLGALATMDSDGFAVTGLVVRKLRFERLYRACDEARRAFDTDPGAFVEMFESYERQVPATAWFPEEEAVLFEHWLEQWRGGTERT